MDIVKYPLVLVGGSIASISFIRTLRAEGNREKILLVYGEDRLPYKRTRINKNMVRGFERDDFIIANENWYAENNVDLLNGWAVSIDRKSKQVIFKNGVRVGYEKLLLATGARPVKPSILGIESDEIHYVQNASDVERLLAVAKDKKRFLIIGGGVEGIETADQLIRKGKEVIVAGRMKYPLQKLFPYDFAEELEKAMARRGVELLSGVSVSVIHKVDYSYQTKLKGKVKEFDALVVCAGSLPEISLAIETGLKTEKGVVVDEWMRTSDPDIMAAGDVAQHKNRIVTGLWHAAEHQGRLAALNLYANTQSHTLPPYRLKTEVFNLFMFSAGYEMLVADDYETLKERQGNVLRWLYFQDDKLKAVLMLNDGTRAKVYQQALMEGWSSKRVKADLPLQSPLSFNFTSSL